MGQLESKVYPAYFDNMPQLDGKVIAITGCTTGTGFVAAKACAMKGAEVIMLNRPSERADKALESVQKEAPGSKVMLIHCDLNDFDSVKTAAAEVKKKFPNGIDVLCNNAGIMALKDAPSKQGYCVQMATNHLSHFLLTKELMPLLEAAAARNGEARVVNHSSQARTRAKYEGKYLEKRGGDLGGDENGLLPLSGPRYYHQLQAMGQSR